MPLPWCAPPFRPLPPNAAANIAVQTGIPRGATRMPHWQRRCPRASPPDQLDPKDRSRDHFFRLYVSHLRVAYLPCRLDFVGKLLVQLQYRQCLVYKVFYTFIYRMYMYIYIPVYLIVLVCSISGSSWNSATTIASSGLMASRSDRARSTSHHEAQIHGLPKKIQQIKADSKLLQDAFKSG